MGAPPARNPRNSMAYKRHDDRRASAFPSIGGRRSTNHGMRNQTGSVRSSMAYNSRGMRTDPRQLNDRHYMQECVKNLISFVIERGYEQPLSPKILTNPSSKDFQHIFLFLVRRIDPTYSFQKRFEEEVPVLLRLLGYPFSISRSALSAVGSPHTWPTLLGVLTWLMGLLKYDEQLISQQERDVALEPQARRNKVFNENMVEAYAQFLQGADTFPELDAALEEHFKTENMNRDEEIEKLEADRTELSITLQALKTQSSPLQLINDHKMTLETNIRKFKLLIPSLLEHSANVKKKISEKDAEVELEKNELAELTTEKARLTEVLAAQEEAAIDVERIAASKENLREGLQRLALDRTAAEADQKGAEQLVATAAASLDSTLKEYNSGVANLGLVTSEGTPRRGRSANMDCEISISRDASLTQADQILSKNTEKYIVPKVRSLKESYAKKIPNLQEESLKLDEEVDEMEERLIVQRHELSLMETRTNNLEAEYQSKKVAMNEQLKERSEEILRKEGDIAKVRERMQDAIREKDKQISLLSDQLHSLEEQFALERKRIAALIARDERRFEDHQRKARDCVMRVKEHLDNATASSKNEKALFDEASARSHS